MRSAIASRAVSIRTGTRLPSRRRRRHTSRPSMSGRPTSSTTASGTPPLTSESAVDPSWPSGSHSPPGPATAAARPAGHGRRPPPEVSWRHCHRCRADARALPTQDLFRSGLGTAVAQDRAEDAVDEAGGLGAAESLRGLDGLVDRSRWSDRVLGGQGRPGRASRPGRRAGSSAPVARSARATSRWRAR